MYAIEVKNWVKTKKKGYRCSPTFVNLKSNTMKNTLQRYSFSFNLQTIGQKKIRIVM